MDFYERYKVDVPEAEKGGWAIQRYTVSQADAELDALRGLMRDGRFVSAGTYTRLIQNDGTIWMSDTPDEIRDHWPIFNNGAGVVLLHGLGLGVTLQALLRKDTVYHVTVIEIEQAVIDLVEPHYRERFPGRSFEIIHADALTWQPPKGVQYNAVWHDIWPDLSMANLPEMHRLHRRYGRRSHWQASWGRAYLEAR